MFDNDDRENVNDDDVGVEGDDKDDIDDGDDDVEEDGDEDEYDHADDVFLLQVSNRFHQKSSRRGF